MTDLPQIACKRCERYRRRLENIAKATRLCLREWRADRDTGQAYADLRREGERIDRMLQRERQDHGSD